MSDKAEDSVDTSSLSVSQDVEELLRELIVKYKFASNSEVIYSIGAEAGDNYASKTVAVDIKDDKELLSLFLKYSHGVENDTIPLTRLYSNEIYFYDAVCPALLNFAEERGTKDYFTNIPKCYGTSIKHVIALGNLKKEGYELFDRKKIMNESHINAVLKTFARYHALCFAFKDQEKECFEKITSEIFDVFADQKESNPMVTLYTSLIEMFISQYDPVEDRHILDKCKNVWEKFGQYVIDSRNDKKEYAIIAKGDNWSNNIMFRYEGDNENPTDVILLDWQMIRYSSVAVDLSYFFYTVACDDELEKLEDYLRLYHEELGKCITELGSDPDILYPYSVLKQEWKQHCIFGYMSAVFIINIMLLDKENAPVLAQEEINNTVEDFAKIKVSGEYIRRMKKLTEHFVKNDFI